ncbi:D-alanine--D-alanine ligase family protein [Actinorugispora endophytica]|uniref:D-alanine--D-alanine ligase n=1 Tax=Actinorugispora endophytica TaxID=1605990 RepID=A0A4V3D9F7_9ACTN|nr:D-alanine--D-alanine ligase family protein [Actinorugispora endophytica]TDQ55430.1 D-alanine-D-alanine ligase [Actinorugispora endophytica]
MSERRTRVALIFGGRSGEHDVSCSSAAAAMTHLDRERYEVVPVRITSEGVWVVGPSDTGPAVLDAAALTALTLEEPDSAAGTGSSARVCRSLADALTALGSIDVAFPALHGLHGEDGTVQSLLEMLGVPYVGNGVFASAAGIDKEFSKALFRAAGLPVARGVVLRRPDDDLSPELRGALGLPVFVKPARGGSSLGVTKVRSWGELDAALEQARAVDPKVLVEEAVHGREVDLAVLEDADGELRVGPPLEIRVTDDRRFFDYDAKYKGGSAVFDIPARLSPELDARLRELALRAFEALDCAGLMRVDFFLRDGVDPVVNEVNTFPGFTAASQFPQIWQTAGVSYPELLDILIANALGRGDRARRPARAEAAS